MLNAISKPFGWLMLWLYQITGSYGWAVILFGAVVNLILLPFMAKSKKSMMRTSRLQPRIAELQKRHEGNQQKLNEEMQKLYREEKINPLSGCLWSLLPFPILLALYRAIRMPITVMMGVSESMLAEGGAIAEKLTELGYSISNYSSGSSTVYEQIYQSKFITEHFSDFSGLSDKLVQMDYSFIGLDLSTTPPWKFWQFDFSNGVWVVIGLFMIPIISTLLSYLSMKISTAINGNASAGNAQAQSLNKNMMLFMPLMSLYIGFIMPAALGIYWIVNSTLGIVRDFTLTKIYGKQMDKLDAERLERERVKAEEIERKREETERLRALNATAQNKNVSKKKLQASQKQADEERRAAQRRADRQARRERLGIVEDEKPESQVGNRRYARGRAFVEDRYTNPEDAAEATLAAAAESEFGASIDNDVEDDVRADTEVLEDAGDIVGDEPAEDGDEYDYEEPDDTGDEDSDYDDEDTDEDRRD